MERSLGQALQPNTDLVRIAVIGAGAWGTCLANRLCETGAEVHLWVREPEVLRAIRKRRENPVFLPGVRLAAELTPVAGFEEALQDKELVVMAVPSHVFRQVLTDLQPHLPPGAWLLSATKGIENKTLMLMSEVARSVLGEEHAKRFSVLSGPSFAKEVSRRQPTAVTIASVDPDTARRLQRRFATGYFRAYASEDLIGVQLGGALKNVIAIAAGAADGMNLGHNARAALICRGLAEMTRLGVALGANPATFAGLAGLGDLVLTCTGDLSRNRSVGFQIGKGMALKEIVSRMQTVAEGVKTTRSAHMLALKTGVEMPITHRVYEGLYAGKDPRQALRELMSRELKEERNT